jgi:hypothetical protein
VVFSKTYHFSETGMTFSGMPNFRGTVAIPIALYLIGRIEWQRFVLKKNDVKVVNFVLSNVLKML